jgi:hypothetical protein
MAEVRAQIPFSEGDIGVLDRGLLDVSYAEVKVRVF